MSQVSCVICHLSHVKCHMSHVTCQMSCVTCQPLHVFFFIFFLLLCKSGKDSRWRFLDQRGYTIYFLNGNNMLNNGKKNYVSLFLWVLKFPCHDRLWPSVFFSYISNSMHQSGCKILIRKSKCWCLNGNRPSMRWLLPSSIFSLSISIIFKPKPFISRKLKQYF